MTVQGGIVMVMVIEMVVIAASGTYGHLDVKGAPSGYGTCLRHRFAYYTPQY
jgi:hypothetical protein